MFSSSKKKESKTPSKAPSKSGSHNSSKSSSKGGSSKESKPRTEPGWSEWYWQEELQHSYRERQRLDGQWEQEIRYPEEEETNNGDISRPDDQDYDNKQQPEVQYNDEGAAEPLHYNYENPTATQDLYRSASLPSSGFQYTPRTGLSANLTSIPGQGTDISASITGRLGQVAISPPLMYPNGPISLGSGFMSGGRDIPINNDQGRVSNHYYQNTGADDNIYDADDANTSTTSAAPQDVQSPIETTFETPSPRGITMLRHNSGSTTSDHNITALNPQTTVALRDENLDKAFKIHGSHHFGQGKVFKICWTEPAGRGRPANGTEKVRTKYGEDCYTSIRRFVVIDKRDGHSLCLPILTYGNQATTKRGVKPQDHAIIYTKDDKKKEPTPTEIRGEKKLDKKPIRMVPRTPRDRLDPLSRINYAKIYTIEHNVKVCFIGTIHEKSVRYLVRDFNGTHPSLPEDPNTEYSDEEQSASVDQSYLSGSTVPAHAYSEE